MQQKPDKTPAESWEAALGAVVIVLLLVSLGLIAAGGWSWFKGMLESAAPAWIQAVGSIVAIFAAAEIGRRQALAASDLEAKKKAAAEVQKFQIIMALMARAHGLSKDICHAFATAKFSDFDQVSPELMVDTQLALQAMPIFEIPNGLLALDVLTIGRSLGVMHENWLRLLALCVSEPSSLPDKMAELDTLAQEILAISLAALNECKKEIASRGDSLHAAPA
jgi:hypothetical protein